MTKIYEFQDADDDTLDVFELDGGAVTIETNDGVVLLPPDERRKLAAALDPEAASAAVWRGVAQEKVTEAKALAAVLARAREAERRLLDAVEEARRDAYERGHREGLDTASRNAAAAIDAAREAGREDGLAAGHDDGWRALASEVRHYLATNPTNPERALGFIARLAAPPPPGGRPATPEPAPYVPRVGDRVEVVSPPAVVLAVGNGQQALVEADDGRNLWVPWERLRLRAAAEHVARRPAPEPPAAPSEPDHVIAALGAAARAILADPEAEDHLRELVVLARQQWDGARAALATPAAPPQGAGPEDATLVARAERAEKSESWLRDRLHGWQDWAHAESDGLPGEWQGGSWADNARYKISQALALAAPSAPQEPADDTGPFWQAVDDVAAFVSEWADGCRGSKSARAGVAVLRDPRWRVTVRPTSDEPGPECFGGEDYPAVTAESLNAPQPPPRPAPGPAAWDLVRVDIEERDRMGTVKYGQRLTPGDGRDTLVDAYQEALDLVVYLRKAIAERSPVRPTSDEPGEVE